MEILKKKKYYIAEFMNLKFIFLLLIIYQNLLGQSNISGEIEASYIDLGLIHLSKPINVADNKNLTFVSNTGFLFDAAFSLTTGDNSTILFKPASTCTHDIDLNDKYVWIFGPNVWYFSSGIAGDYYTWYENGQILLEGVNKTLLMIGSEPNYNNEYQLIVTKYIGECNTISNSFNIPDDWSTYEYDHSLWDQLDPEFSYITPFGPNVWWFGALFSVTQFFDNEGYLWYKNGVLVEETDHNRYFPDANNPNGEWSVKVVKRPFYVKSPTFKIPQGDLEAPYNDKLQLY